eukprot:gnl/TRDRNA2_/TRDRNA2_134013_c2_seq1.p1 gnl/TRDRNA2_/TRDRNA2_134013_c2~~gnl/TRDRNA2_/TRDRNA2_134013_c2_seq1.p1  ORF type:complete len:120 (+),score=13.69 gnl/TRDRNA2_/TRDRNA2_134013_c2_seq1:262-621(+)
MNAQDGNFLASFVKAQLHARSDIFVGSPGSTYVYMAAGYRDPGAKGTYHLCWHGNHKANTMWTRDGNFAAHYANVRQCAVRSGPLEPCFHLFWHWQVPAQECVGFDGYLRERADGYPFC